MADEQDWPFDQPPDAAAITVRAVLDGAPILLVSHDADDDGWQFLDGNEVDLDKAVLISMARGGCPRSVHPRGRRPAAWLDRLAQRPGRAVAARPVAGRRRTARLTDTGLMSKSEHRAPTSS